MRILYGTSSNIEHQKDYHDFCASDLEEFMTGGKEILTAFHYLRVEMQPGDGTRYVCHLAQDHKNGIFAATCPIQTAYEINRGDLLPCPADQPFSNLSSYTACIYVDVMTLFLPHITEEHLTYDYEKMRPKDKWMKSDG